MRDHSDPAFSCGRWRAGLGDVIGLPGHASMRLTPHARRVIVRQISPIVDGVMSIPEQLPGQPSDLVVIGSSAGGIEALSILVSTLPADFPAPIIIAQHLDPQRPSSLASILERRSPLPVVQVSSTTPLHSGTVYVVPSNRHIVLRDGHIIPEEDHRGRPRPSIDLLLSSASAVYGDRLIAIILTGSGSDGAAGAIDVKNVGGTIIIQNPQTARYPSMPLALPPTGVDHVADIERIGPLVYDIIKGIALPEPQERLHDSLRDILNYISRHTNIDFRQYKQSTILRRISRRMAVTHSQTLQDYLHYLEAHPFEVGELVMAFLIKVTEFFRDPDAFSYLREVVMPLLIEHGRQHGRVLRFWSAGCATGEEPYSLALLIADMLGAELPEWNIKVFATDIDEGAITYARRGIYPRNVLDNMPDHYRSRYFEQMDLGFRIVKPLRQMVIFGQQDLSRGAPFPRIDLVVCRNVLIYFKPELQQQVLDIFAYSLHHASGYLFLGKAETARPSKATFELVEKRWKVYRCTSGPIPVPSRQGSAPGALPAAYRSGSAPAQQPTEPRYNEHESQIPTMDVAQLRRLNETLLRFLPLGITLIDRTYRIITINGPARRLLGIRDSGNDQDFLHTARGLPYTQVRTGIDLVFREHTTTTLPELELEGVLGNPRYLTLSITAITLEPNGPELAMISVSDVTEQVQTRRKLEAVQIEQKQLLSELNSTNQRLSEMNKELQDANEELQAANEEMMLTQEELQATNEEFEATNEELQATNEELETNNEELQATNEELEATNDELNARSSELQDLARKLESERIRLIGMVELAPFAIMVLRGPELAVETLNASFARLLAGREVHGWLLEDVLHLLGGAGTPLMQAIREAQYQDAAYTTPACPFTIAGVDGALAERHIAFTVLPIHDGDGHSDGVMVYAEDVPVR
ncbi:PAS domain-containing protein [Chloroflexia bacterium SDU3-3]|nr:PAS domain-containing protein [Chloroflexia bacterium SDU3-3]